jgi:hypothetical protein
LLGPLQEVQDGLASRGEVEEGLGLEQEGAVVADVVDDGELLVGGGLPEAAAELLEPEDAGLGGAEHEDLALGAEVSPEWTATARRPCSLKKAAMKSACLVETQKARVRVPLCFSSWSKAFLARVWVATCRVSSSSSNLELRQGMLR